MTFEASGTGWEHDEPPGEDPEPSEIDMFDVGDIGCTPYGADALDLVLEIADMRACIAAQQLVRVDALRREALRDAETQGRALTDVLERSVRLELAAALRITEHAADEMIAFAEALVHRYP